MGVSLAWIAVRGPEPAQTLDRLGLAPTGVESAYPPSQAAVHILPDGWLLVIAPGCDHRILHGEALAALSAKAEVVACSVEEHVDFTQSELWRDGRRVWHLRHQGEEGDDHLVAEGDLPPSYPRLLAGVATDYSEDPEVYFHGCIPLLLAKERCGFRHDDAEPSFDDGSLKALQDLRRVARPWWRRLFS